MQAIYDHAGGNPFLVVGKVALWGTVIPGERGWRASLAYPQTLIFIDKPWLDRGQRIAVEDSLDRYGVAVDVMNWGDLKQLLSQRR